MGYIKVKDINEEKLLTQLQDLSAEARIDLHNEATFQANCGGLAWQKEKIYTWQNVDFAEDLFPGDDIDEVIRSVYQGTKSGKFNLRDKYIRMGRDGNIESTNFLQHFLRVEDLLEGILEIIGYDNEIEIPDIFWDLLEIDEYFEEA